MTRSRVSWRRETCSSSTTVWRMRVHNADNDHGGPCCAIQGRTRARASQQGRKKVGRAFGNTNSFSELRVASKNKKYSHDQHPLHILCKCTRRGVHVCCDGDRQDPRTRGLLEPLQPGPPGALRSRTRVCSTSWIDRRRLWHAPAHPHGRLRASARSTAHALPAPAHRSAPVKDRPTDLPKRDPMPGGPAPGNSLIHHTHGCTEEEHHRTRGGGTLGEEA